MVVMTLRPLSRGNLIGRRGYSRRMGDNIRVERGWIIVNGTRSDDGTVVLGTGGEMRFSPFDALQERRSAQIPPGAILKASVQRLAFWRR
jgi:hypothetical protein